MLTQRQKDILRLIIQNYTKNNQPVGSKKLMNDGIDASSATIRNEMKSLEEHGLLAKTHSSSGRIPSIAGYRYYVDYLLKPIDFEELKEFVKKVRFDRMGAFAYSEEEGTFAAKEYEDSISHEVKQQRLDELMALQQEIAGELSQTKIGKEFKVIIDRKEGDYYIGRTQFDSPEVDPEVLIKADDEYLKIGEFYKVKITAADDFDLYASIL